MKAWKLTDGTQLWQVLSGRINSFLIRTPEGVTMLVDTGMENARKTLVKNIEASVGTGIGIDYLFLTHTHFDHCRNAHFLKEKFGCQIIVHHTEAQYVQNGYTPVPGGTNSFTRFISKPGKAIGARWFGYEAFEPDILLDNKPVMPDEIPALQVVYTPGHTAGSVSLILNREIALAGDALFGGFSNRVLSPFADDTCELIRSWKRLLDTGCSMFISGHGGPISRELLEREYSRYAKKFS